MMNNDSNNVLERYLESQFLIEDLVEIPIRRDDFMLNQFKTLRQSTLAIKEGL